MAVQHTSGSSPRRPLPGARVASLNLLLTSTCWQSDHSSFSYQGRGLIDTIPSKRGTVAHIYPPSDANCPMSVANHCLTSRTHVNLNVIGKQPQLQHLDMATIRAHCGRGTSAWDWAGNDDGDPDIALCAGDIPTMETVAAARCDATHPTCACASSVVDPMTLLPSAMNRHRLPAAVYAELFTADTNVVFAFHGYPHAIHELLHGRPSPDRSTTPFVDHMPEVRDRTWSDT